MYIGAVGTKVYFWDEMAGALVEDQQWTKTLDRDWDLGLVRQSVDQLIQEIGGDYMHYRPKVRAASGVLATPG